MKVLCFLTTFLWLLAERGSCHEWPRVRGSSPRARGSSPRERGSSPRARGSFVPRVRGSFVLYDILNDKEVVDLARFSTYNLNNLEFGDISQLTVLYKPPIGTNTNSIKFRQFRRNGQNVICARDGPPFYSASAYGIPVPMDVVLGRQTKVKVRLSNTDCCQGFFAFDAVIFTLVNITTPAPTTAEPTTAEPTAEPTTAEPTTPEPTMPNRNPIAVDDEATTTENANVWIPVLDNDSDPDGDPLSIVFISAIGMADIDVNETEGLTFIPDGDFGFLAPGEITFFAFSYAIADGRGGIGFARVNVTIVGE